MKYLLMMMTALFIFGCSTKRKWQRQTTQSSESKLNEQEEAQLHYRHTMLEQQSDSSAVKQWFKIYPKGEVQFSNGNFIGQVDSLWWYTSSVSLQKQLQTQRDDTITKHKQQTTASALSKTEERVKEKQKLWLSWWPLILGLLAGLLVYLVLKRVRTLFT